MKVILALACFAVSFGVYYLTMYPGVAAGDSTEMVVAAYVLGVPHQPGYPLNTLLGYVFKNLPIPVSEVTRINMTSAFLQSLGVFLFYWLMLELIKLIKAEAVSEKSVGSENRSRIQNYADCLAAFTAALVLGFSLIYWEYATRFEVFPLNNVFAILILWSSAKIALAYKSAGQIKLSNLAGYGLLWGLALVHHQTIIFVAPAAGIIFWEYIKSSLETKESLGRAVLATGSGLALGISVYFFLILMISARDPWLNYGNIKSFDAAFKALVRSEYGTFFPYLKADVQSMRSYPVEQIEYYLRNAVGDFSLLVTAFIILGFFNLYKKSRRVLYAAVVGILFSGILFLSYARYPLFDSFNQATVRRFHMLPNIFLAIASGFGLHLVFERLYEMKKKAKNKLGVNLAFLYLSASFLLPVYTNYKKADNSRNNLTEVYIKSALERLPRDAIFMYSGDFGNMTADFFRYVKIGEPERTFFSPGQFFSDWYLPMLLGRQTELEIPLPEFGKRFTATTQIARANYGRAPIYVNPELVSKDPGLEREFTLYPRHLLYEVKKKGEDLKIEEWKAENEAIFNSLDLSLLREVETKAPNFEQDVVFFFARHFYNAGRVYEEVSLFEDAIREYERALKVAPNLRDAYAALGRIWGEKMPEPDYARAVDYLSVYRSLLVYGEERELMETQKKMGEYYKKYEEKVKRE